MATEDRVIRIKVDASQALPELRKMDKRLSALQRTAQATQRSFARLNRVGGLLLGGSILVRGVQNLVRLNDQYDEMESRVALVARETVGVTQAMTDLLKASNATLTSLEGSAALYARLGVATKDLGTSHEELIQLVQVVADTLRLSGASSKESAAFMTQFSQAMASGKFSGDEFRSMLESNVYMSNLLAEAFDTNVGGLRAMSEAGELGINVLEKLLERQRAVREEAEKLPRTVGREWTRFGNNFQTLLDQVSDGVGVFESLANAIGFVNDRFEELLEINRMDAQEAMLDQYRETTTELERLRKEQAELNRLRAEGIRVLTPRNDQGEQFLDDRIKELEAVEKRLAKILFPSEKPVVITPPPPPIEEVKKVVKGPKMEIGPDAFFPQSAAEQATQAYNEQRVAINQMIQSAKDLVPQLQAIDDAYFEGNISMEKHTELTEDLMGVQGELQDSTDDTVKEVNALTVALGNTLAQATSTAADAMLDFAIRGEGAFSDMAQSILESIAKVIIQMTILRSMQNAFGSYFPGSALAPTPSANGNAFSGGSVVPFAKGGVVNQPTIFPMANGAGLMGEAGPEAIMPLSRDSRGRLGVSGGGTVVNVINNSGEGVTQERSQQSDGTEMINIIVGEVDRRIVEGGSTWNAISQATGSRRAATAMR